MEKNMEKNMEKRKQGRPRNKSINHKSYYDYKKDNQNNLSLNNLRML